MEHESFVPTPSARLAEAFRTPGTVASALPGWQPDPDAPIAGRTAYGRLRLRIAGSTITYRGSVTVKGGSAPFSLVAEGTEVRGSGAVRLTARVTLTETEQPEPGTAVTYRGSAEVQGRLAGYDPAVVDAAVRRLLDRFSAELAAVQASAPAEPGPEAEPEPAAEAEPAPEPEAEPKPELADEPPARPEGLTEEPAGGPADPEDESDVVDDLGDPAPELEEFELVEVEVEVPESAAALDDLVPPAEAAHARRTMIGRSAEEVDHAPPRGRYAPVPAPDASSAAATLRWAAPAAAALLASAVVVGRVLRRRK
jgi:carbon monoxide dehydrogenase subunit G